MPRKEKAWIDLGNRQCGRDMLDRRS